MRFWNRRIAFASLPFLILAIGFPCAAQPQSKAAPSSAPVAALAETTRVTADHGSPVLLDGDTLFVLHAALGPFTAEARAAALAERLRALSHPSAVRHDTVVAVDQPSSTDLFSGDIVVMTVLDGDAKASGRPRLVLAREWSGRINTRLEQRRIAT
jgi:hypothetical protein